MSFENFEHVGRLGEEMTSDTTQKSRREVQVLIVDDEEPVRRSLRRILNREGYRCTTARSAREGRRLLEEMSFDLLLCDLIMPEESGFSLVAYAQSDRPQMAVVVVSAINSPFVAEPIANGGADGYIVKPFDSNTILINVVGALRRRATLFTALKQRSILERGIGHLADELDVALGRRATELHGATGQGLARS
jgi:putative two-component system response regulator